MKRVSVILLSATLLGLTAGWLVRASAHRWITSMAATVVPAEERQYLGVVPALTGVNFDVKLLNRTNRRWNVEKIMPNCGCILVLPGDRALDPRSELVLPMRLEAPALPPGPHIATEILIECVSESGERKHVVQTVVADTRPALRALPGRIVFDAPGDRMLYIFGPENLVAALPARIDLQGDPTTVTLKGVGESSRIVSRVITLSRKQTVTPSAREVLFVVGNEPVLRIAVEMRP